MQGRKNRSMQPHDPALLQQRMPRHEFVQLDALQLPPLDDPEDVLPELEPDELSEPEFESTTQVPKLQTSLFTVQSMQATAAEPQRLFWSPVWQVPFESQHPLTQVCVQTPLAPSDVAPASSPLVVPLMLPPLLVPLPALPLLMPVPLWAPVLPLPLLPGCPEDEASGANR
jgi:hypothetical protein